MKLDWLEVGTGNSGDLALRIHVNDHGSITIRNARITGLTVSGALLGSVPEGGGFRIEVDEETLRHLRDLIDSYFSEAATGEVV